MALISLTIRHGRTQEDARRRLETAVREISTKLGVLLRRVEWAADRNRVRLDGVGFWMELWVDAEAVHVTGDAPMLGRLLGGPVTSRLKHMIEGTFLKKLP
jgi:Putative polyhydroxyalkanoic acid system protein (PHA_gran_rgn)